MNHLPSLLESRTRKPVPIPWRWRAIPSFRDADRMRVFFSSSGELNKRQDRACLHFSATGVIESGTNSAIV